MGARFQVALPSGALMTVSEPLHPHLAKQLANGTLRLVDPTSPPVVDDGEGGVSRVETPPPADRPAAPAGNASQAEWAAYAVACGVPADEADSLKREELKARIDALTTPADPTPEG
jgi:hypothetical protein